MSLRVRADTFELDYQRFVIVCDGSQFTIRTPKGNTRPGVYPLSTAGFQQALWTIDRFVEGMRDQALLVPAVKAALDAAIEQDPT